MVPEEFLQLVRRYLMSFLRLSRVVIISIHLNEQLRIILGTMNSWIPVLTVNLLRSSCNYLKFVTFRLFNYFALQNLSRYLSNAPYCSFSASFIFLNCFIVISLFYALFTIFLPRGYNCKLSSNFRNSTKFKLFSSVTSFSSFT